MSSSEADSDNESGSQSNSESNESEQSEKEIVETEGDLSDKYIRIEVCDPIKQGDKMKQYISYTVKTTSNMSAYAKSPYKVQRRYNDFVWIYDQLVNENQGYIVPPLPEKMALGRFSPEFIEARRRGLEIFLNAVCQHMVLKRSKLLKSFLVSSSSSFASKVAETKLKLDATSAIKVMTFLGKGLMEVGTKAATLATDTVNQMKGQGRTERGMSNEDMEFTTISENIRTMAETVVTIRKAAEEMDKREKDLYEVYNAYSCDLSALSQSEESDAAIAYACLAGALHSASDIQREKAAKERLLFLEQFKQYVALCESVIKVIKQRELKAQCIEQAREELLKSKLAHSKADGAKRKELERGVKKCKKNVEKAINSVEEITNIVKSEIKRFNVEKMVSFRETIVNFLVLQKIYDQRFQKVFADVCPDLKDINIEKLATTAAEKAETMITIEEEEPEKDEDKKRRERRLKRKEEARKAAMKKREKDKKKSKKHKKSKGKKKESSSESGSDSGEASGSESD